MPYYFSRSSIKFQGHTDWKIDYLNPIWVTLLDRSPLSNPSDLFCYKVIWNWMKLWWAHRNVHETLEQPESGNLIEPMAYFIFYQVIEFRMRHIIVGIFVPVKSSNKLVNFDRLRDDTKTESFPQRHEIKELRCKESFRLLFRDLSDKSWTSFYWTQPICQSVW